MNNLASHSSSQGSPSPNYDPQLPSYDVTPKVLREIFARTDHPSTDRGIHDLEAVEAVVAKCIRNEVIDALETYYLRSGRGEFSPNPSFIAGISEIAANAIWYSYGGLESIQRRKYIDTKTNKADMILPEPKPISIDFTLQGESLVIEISGGYPTPAKMQSKWDEAALRHENELLDGQSITGNLPSLAELIALAESPEPEDPEDTDSSLDLGGRGFLIILGGGIKNMSLEGDAIKYTAALSDIS